MNTTIPNGYRERADGSLVPESLVSDIDKLRDQTIETLMTGAKALNAQIATFKDEAFSDLAAFVSTSHELYGVKTGGKKGNLTIVSFNGRYKIIRQVQDRLAFDERLQAAKTLIDECIMVWSEGSRDEIKVLVNDAFRVDQDGKINTGRVLGLRRLKIKDEKWQRAMTAISDSLRVDGSKPYIRFYERAEGSDEYTAIPLDFAAV